MNVNIVKHDGKKALAANAVLVRKNSSLSILNLSKDEKDFVTAQLKSDKKFITLNRYKSVVFLIIIDKKEDANAENELARKAADKLVNHLNDFKIKELTVSAPGEKAGLALAFAEGLALAGYQFLKYFKDAAEKTNSLQTVFVDHKDVSKVNCDELNIVTEATNVARTLVNEPLSYLTATVLADEIKKLGRQAGFKVEVLDKKRIEALKMGGLLAVNKGSIDPPTFTILEWKPAKAKNKKPIVFVGKGVVFDTGGLSLKPTKGSMDLMKSDMAGAAAVAGSIYAIAKAKLPVHVIGLVPATDNRPDGNAYVPGDVVKMMSGLNIEVLNTVAEGRMLLGDALHYAKKYNPELVIDLATLTGAAVAAIGKYGIVSMGTANEKQMSKLAESGNRVFERLAPMPFWDDYAELLKSDIADMKNIGGPHAGAITAGKFLERFTDYPWIHLDIAGPSFVEQRDSYRGTGGTGVGVRLLFDFAKNS